MAGNSGFATSAPQVVNIICRDWLGMVGGILALLGIVAAPITTGDTALRSARLIIADFIKESNGVLKKFDFIVSNPPFKLDFPEYRDTLAADTIRFWAGVPNAVKKVDPNKPKMAIYTCFIQHLLNSLKPTGKGAIVIPTGFITSKSGVEKRILQRIVDEKWVYGCVSTPSNDLLYHPIHPKWLKQLSFQNKIRC